MSKPARNQDFQTFYGILFCFLLLYFKFYCCAPLKSLHTLVIGKDSKSRQQTSAVLPIQGGKASIEHRVSGKTEAKRKSDPQDKKLLELSK